MKFKNYQAIELIIELMSEHKIIQVVLIQHERNTELLQYTIIRGIYGKIFNS